jgi:hypothetical protein
VSADIAVGYIRTTMLTRVLPIVGEDRFELNPAYIRLAQTRARADIPDLEAYQ